jgi:hypothetical protein
MDSNIKITTASGRQIDYNQAEDLSIKMNRIADDLQDIEARYGEFSYSFSLPMTRRNTEIFGFAGVQNMKNIFKINPVDIKVFNNDLLLLTGQLELQSIENNKYKCVFFSKLTQLVDDLQDKNMQDISTCPKIPWAYEDTIRAHINSGLTSCDDTPYQFPLVFYNTFYAPSNSFTGLTDTIVDYNGTTAHAFQRERAWQNWYYIVNHAASKTENEMYMHQIPLAFYLKPMMEYMLADAGEGWTIGGSFWEDEDIKRIICPYVGDTDVYDRACYCSTGVAITGSSCGAGTLMLDTSKFMPDYGCLDFLEDIVKLFNLYMMIDINNRTIIFESYDVMFGNKAAPYNINNKVIGDIVVSRVDDYNPSIGFNEIDNQRILGDNKYIASSGTSAYDLFTTYRIASNNNLFQQVFNHVGSTDGEIGLGFGAPAVKTMRIRNDYNYADSNQSAGDHVLFLPMITKALPEDNTGKPFNKKDSDTSVYNTEETIQYKGKPALYYYYGISTSDFVQHSGKGAQSDYFYVNFDDVNQKIGFCSPFALTSYRNNVNTVLEEAGQNPTGSTADAGVMLASYMQSIYLMMASSTGVSNTTQFSLILADNNDYGDTIYTRFHANKYKRYQQSEVLTINIRCTDVDWRQMEINQPILFKNQIYSIMAINGYDIVKSIAELILIKQI